MLVSLHQGMGLRRARRQTTTRLHRAKNAVDDRLDAARLDPGPHCLAQRLGNRCLEGHGARTQCRTGDRQATAQHHAGIELALDAALHCDDDQATVFGQGLNFTRQIIASDHVQDHIHTSATSDALGLGNEI